MKKSLFFLLFATSFFVSFSQTLPESHSANHLSSMGSSHTLEECASGQIHTHMMQNDPVYAQKIQSTNSLIKQYSKSILNNKSGGVLEIPVVVHVIHTGQAVGTGANISMAQINSAITRMNDRFRNTHGSSVDTQIEFVLAQRDPDGNATNGVVRVDGSSVTNYATEGITAGNGSGADETAIKDLSRWSNTDYYNIWVVTEIEDNGGLFGIQGYAYFPGASSSIDGTVIMHTCFGTTGTVNSFNNEGRTLVHELGHGLNLYHTFEGDADGTTCPSGNGDEVADTDPHIRASSNCPTGTNSCTGGSIDGVTSNFMNYSSQTCALEFTTGQSTRMRAAIMTSRPSLLSSLGGTAPGATVASPACTTATGSPSNGFGIGILGVELNDLNVVSGSTNSDGGTGYIDRSILQQANVDAGSSYSLTITTGSANNEDVSVFIDYNNDGDFLDANETVFTDNVTSGSPVNSVHTGNITIPANGITTNTPIRMRVISDWYNNSITGSCYNPGFGQTEDYALYITSSGPALSVSTSVSNVNCNGNTDGSAIANASGGTTPYTYIWSNGSSSSNNTSLSAGAYTVTVVDNSGSTSTATATISEPTAINATLTTTNSDCSNNGTASVAVSGGSSPYSYIWSNSGITSSISNLGAGTYTVTIADANGCTISRSGSVTQNCSVNLFLTGPYCNATNIDPLNSLLHFTSDPDATNYRVRVNGSGVSNFVYTTTQDRFNVYFISGMQYSQSYTVEIAAFIGGQWSNYGSPCTITTKAATNINLTLTGPYCNATNLDPTNSLLHFTSRSDATSYRVRVNGSGVSNFVYTTTQDRFNLYFIPGMQYSQSYTVEIAAFIGGQWSSYGSQCTITTRAATNINLTLTGPYCNATNLDPTNSLLHFTSRSDATNYRVRVNGSGVSNFVYTTTQSRFNVYFIPGMQYSQSYTVEIAAFIGGQWSNYGSPCTITTRAVTSINLTLTGPYCNATNLNPTNSLLHFTSRSDATNYRVRVNGSGVSNFVYTTTRDRFNLFYITGMQYNQSYTVEVAAFISGQWSNYGNPCTITTEPSPSLSPQSRLISPVIAVNEMEGASFNMFPNPSKGEVVTIKYRKAETTSSIEEQVILEVYDIKGKRILRKWLKTHMGQLSTEVNNDLNMKAGVYFIRLEGGGNQMVKKLVVQ